jgi:urea transport system permease protein
VLSESKAFLETWTLIMGVLFVLVVIFLPKGLAGLGQTVRARLRQAKDRRDEEAISQVLKPTEGEL